MTKVRVQSFQRKDSVQYVSTVNLKNLGQGWLRPGSAMYKLKTAATNKTAATFPARTSLPQTSSPCYNTTTSLSWSFPVPNNSFSYP